MRIIVMGCGRVGEQLARLLSGEGHAVSVIDYDAAALNRLGADFRGRLVNGLGFDRDVLIEAGIEQADAFAAVTSNDNANIVAARIARDIFRVPRVVTRLFEPRRAEIYRRFGLVTISSTTWGAERIRELLLHRELDAVRSFGGGEVTLIDVEVPLSLVDRTVRDLTVPGELNVVAITRDGRALLPLMGTVFRRGDMLHLAVLAEAMDRLEDLLGVSEGG
jgi:trk system potassium uptake protein TrkA